MKRWRLLLVAAAVLAVGAIVVPTAAARAAQGAHHRHHVHHVVFVQTNGLKANRIMVYDRAWNGKLSFVASYATGGKGGMTTGSAADPLSSQGSLVTADQGRVLLAVNAGSNTVSFFRVRGDHLWLKQVAASGGQFPASIAVHDQWVYVLNAGGAGSVQGYWLGSDRLWRMRHSHRALGLGNTNPPDFVHSPGQVGFTPDGRRLIVTTKASTSAIDVFAIGDRGVLSGAMVSNPSTSPVPFAFTFDPWGRLVVVEAAMSHLTTYAIKPDNSLTGIGSVADGYIAACWISAARGFYYISNAGSGNLSSYELNGSGAPLLVNAAAATVQAGVTDSVTTIDQHFLYVECGGAGTLDAFRVNHDGTLTLIQTITGLPIPFEGIAQN